MSHTHSDSTIKLQGFNNLVKTLTFTTCRVIRVGSKIQMRKYLEHINNEWGTQSFITLFDKICTTLDAHILNISNYDFDPVGASVNALLADCNYTGSALSFAHLDKSHMAVHTYPEMNEKSGIITFRADFDISTCGLISPLKILNLLMKEIAFNVVTIDYKVRGFTRTASGKKIYNDLELDSITDHIDDDFANRFTTIDYNYPEINTWQSRLMRTEIDWTSYLSEGLDCKSHQSQSLIQKEIKEIFFARENSCTKAVESVTVEEQHRS